MGHLKMQVLIEFDNQSKTYYAGQTVTGRLVVQLPKEKSFRSKFPIKSNASGDTNLDEHCEF